MNQLWWREKTPLALYTLDPKPRYIRYIFYTFSRYLTESLLIAASFLRSGLSGWIVITAVDRKHAVISTFTRLILSAFCSTSLHLDGNLIAVQRGHLWETLDRHEGALSFEKRRGKCWHCFDSWTIWNRLFTTNSRRGSSCTAVSCEREFRVSVIFLSGPCSLINQSQRMAAYAWTLVWLKLVFASIYI